MEEKLRAEFNKRTKNLKLDEHAREELFDRFLALYKYGGFKCAYCDERMGLKYGDTELAFTIDHIKAQVHGGTDNIFNLTFACQSCNSMKKDKDAGWFANNVKRLKLRKQKKRILESEKLNKERRTNKRSFQGHI